MLWFLCLLVLSTVIAEKATFHNYQVHRVVPENQEQLQALQGLEAEPNGLEFWKGPTLIQKNVDIMVPPHLLPWFAEIVETLKLKSEVYISNVQHLIDTERPKSRPPGSFGWTDYYTLEEINAWLDSLPSTYPGIVTPIVGGVSFQHRQIRGVKVSFRANNPVVIFEGGIHAREWISPATVTYILNELLTSDDPVIQDLARSFDYYFFPVFNPDGYVFTHTTNRMWRKTRRPTWNPICVGTDANRNWDFHWMVSGASNNPCAETYAGEAPFSEPETRSLARYFENIQGNIVAYLDFHNSGQMLMYPFGLTDVQIPNHAELNALASEAIAALAQHSGTVYTFGSIHDTIYPAAGGSIDWVGGVLKTRFPFVWELRDRGTFGHLLPADQIIDTSEEAMLSVVTILQYAKNNP